MTLDTTIGGSAADSYATTKEIDSYLETTGYGLAEWENLETPAKERIAKVATQILDCFSIIGSSAAEAAGSDSTQALLFPRDKDSQPKYGSGQIPTEVKEAEAELCYLVVFKNYSKADPSALQIWSLSVAGDFTVRTGDADGVAGGGNIMSGGPVSPHGIVFFKLKDYRKRGAVI
jgi:hypothetical protein